MGSIQIAPLAYVDIPEAQTFMLNIIKSDFGYDYNPNWHKDITNLKESYLSAATSIFLVAKAKHILGTIAARAYDKDFPEFINKYTKENTLSIWRHYVNRQFRGQGIGTKLLAQVEAFAKENGFHYLYLHTQRSIPGSLEYWLAKKYSITHDLNDSLQTVHLEKKI